MNTDPGVTQNAPVPDQPKGRGFFAWPATRLGWWSLGLGILFIILMIINSAVFMRLPEEVSWRVSLLPFYGIFMILCALVAGVTALVAVLRRERSILVMLPLLAGLFMLFMLLGEFLVPH